MAKKDLVRVEMIFSQAIEEDMMEEFSNHKVGNHYTKISGVTGKGFSNPKLGDAIWPQLNIMIIVFCTKEESEKIFLIVENLRKRYPAEGISYFISSAEAK